MNKRKCEYISRWRETRRRVDRFFKSIPDMGDSDCIISGIQHNFHSVTLEATDECDIVDVESAIIGNCDSTSDIDRNTVLGDESTLDISCNDIIRDHSMKNAKCDFIAISESSAQHYNVSDTLVRKKAKVILFPWLMKIQFHKPILTIL